MNILIVDDRGSSSYYLIEWMKGHGFIVFEAFDLLDAQTHWNDRQRVPVHCIVLDLNMPTHGLTESQKERSYGGMLTGWIWFKENVLSVEPGMRQRTIIYSDYIDSLNKYDDPSEYKGITLISKRQRGSSAEEVVARIKEISKMVRY